MQHNRNGANTVTADDKVRIFESEIRNILKHYEDNYVFYTYRPKDMSLANMITIDIMNHYKKWKDIYGFRNFKIEKQYQPECSEPNLYLVFEANEAIHAINLIL